MLKIKKGDTVQVMTGKDRGKTGKVLAVHPTTHRVTVEKVNIVTRHIKPKQSMQKGQRITKEAPIDISNVMVLCPKTKKPSRVGFVVREDGRKVRIAKKSGEELE